MEDLINNQPVLIFLHISKNVTIAWISRRPLVSSFFCQNGLDFVTFHTVIAIYLTFTFVFRAFFGVLFGLLNKRKKNTEHSNAGYFVFSA